MTSRPTGSHAPLSTPRKGRRIAVAGATAFAVAGLALAGGAQWTAHEVRSALAGAGLDVAAVSVDPLSGAVTLDGLSASQNGVQIRVGSIESTGDFALASPASAASAVTLTDIAISGDSITLRIPRLEVSGDDLDEARLRAIFDKTAKTPLAQRLAGLKISKATLPELIIEQKAGDVSSTSTWSQVTITDLHDGVAGAVTAASASFATKADKVDSKGSIGASTMERVNLAHIARIYTEGAASEADRAVLPAYGAFSVNDVRVSSEDANVAIKSVTGKEFRMRLLRAPLIDIMAEIEKVKDPEELEPKARAAYLRNLADVVDAFSFSEAAITGVTFDAPAADDDAEEADADQAGAGESGASKADGGKTQSTKVKPAAERVRGELASIGLSGDPAKGGLTLGGFKMVPAQGDVVSFASASLSGFGVNSLAKFFREQAAALEAGKEADDLSALALDGDFSLNDLTVDVAQDDNPAERVKFTLRNYTGSYRNPVDGVPSSINTAINNLVIDLPKLPDAPAASEDGEEDESSMSDSVRKLRAMGYERLDLSAKLDGGWNAAAKELRIGEISFSAVDLGGLRISGLLGNVSKDVFTTDTDRSQEALMDARLKTLTLGVTDSGFAGRFAAQQAKEQGGDAATIRAGWAALAQMLLPSVLGTSEGAKTLNTALGNFIRANNGGVDITLTSKKPDGDAISDITLSAMSGEPDKLFQQFDVKAVNR